MKVNPIAIQNYQQSVTNRQQPNKADAQDRATAQGVAIEPKNKVESSKLAVKGPSGTYDKYLTDNERKALDMLFSRYAHRAGQTDTAEQPASSVGQVIDVKV
jgi:hypothetical protein